MSHMPTDLFLIEFIRSLIYSYVTDFLVSEDESLVVNCPFLIHPLSLFYYYSESLLNTNSRLMSFIACICNIWLP